MMFPEIIITKLIPSFAVGLLGSAAYITTLYFKFVGDTDANRSIVIKPFLVRYSEKISIWKCLLYCLVGGFIAVVFQYDVPNFVAVQSLILGATWPAIVSQFLSGRMMNPKREEITEALEQVSNSRPFFSLKEYNAKMDKILQKKK